MTRRVILLSAALALTPPAAALAQRKPDFSGAWTVAEKAPESFNGQQYGWGAPATIVITQTATEIIVQSTQWGEGPMKVVYKLDGSDTFWEGQATAQNGRKDKVRWRTKARWDGDKLILYTWNMALVQLKDVISLSGGTLNIIRSLENPGGSGNAKLTLRPS